MTRVWQKNEKIFRFVVQSILPCGASVEDVLQEAFARILQAGSEFDNERDAFNFLRRTVVTTSIDYYRYWRRRRHLLDAGPPSSECARVSERHADPLDRLLHSEQRQLRERTLREVRQALSGLPHEQKEAIEIVFSRNSRKIKDICLEVGIPYSTLRSRMLKGIDRIRRHLKRRGLLQRPGNKAE